MRYAVFGNAGAASAVPSTLASSQVRTILGYPSTSVDNAAVRFDGTTGNTQDSVLVIADATGALSRSGNGGIPIQGTNTNDNAASGDVGEYSESTIPSTSAVSLTNGVAANMTSLHLTAGDWDVTAALHFGGNAATTVSYAEGSISVGSAAPENGSLNTTYMANVTYFGSINGAGFGVVTGTRRVSIASTAGSTTIYAVAQAGFAVNTMNVYGTMRARRVR